MDVIDLIEKGEFLYESGDSSSAKKKFLQAASLAPEDPQIYNRLGMLEMSRSSPEAARGFYEKACRLAPEVARYHMRLGDSKNKDGGLCDVEDISCSQYPNHCCKVR